MDPVTMIVTALAAGAAASAQEVAAQAVKDSYAALKARILRKFGQKGDVGGAVEVVEGKPSSEPRKAVLREELEAAGAADDSETVQQAQALLDLLKEHGWISAPSYHAELRGSGAIAQGPGAKAVGERGVLIEGDVQGDITTGDTKATGQNTESA
jgi:hypothetical protein